MAVPDRGSPSTSRRLGLDPELAYQIVEGLHIGMYITDERERIIAVNSRAEELLARPAEELIGSDAHELLHRGAGGRLLPRSQCPLMKAFLGNRPEQGGKKWFARGDGTLLPVIWRVTPYELYDGATGVTVAFYEHGPWAREEAEPEDHVTALADLADDLSLLSEATAALTSTLEVEEALRRLVRLVTPRLADWAVVDLLSEHGELKRVAVVHHRAGLHVNVPEFEGPLPPAPESSTMPLTRVLRGAPATRIGPEDYMGPLDAGLAGVQRELFHRTGIHAAIAAPLRAPREAVIGALTLGRADKAGDFEPAELALVEDIARRAGLAVNNARLYERQQRVAETMQRYLLPSLPRTGGLEMAARYRPAPRASEVGGDWYDAFLLPDGVMALVIGDVVGHDIQAAAHMAEIRSMLRAFAWDRAEPPNVIVDRLDQALPHISRVPLATLTFARVEEEYGGPWRLYWTNAGHPPPLLITDDGRTRLLESGYNLLLGTGFAATRTNTSTPLPPMATVLFYTDGLVEAPGRSLEDGLAELVRSAAVLARRPLEELCDELINRVRPPDSEDDLALIALRTPAPQG